jgi:hypothetical protein
MTDENNPQDDALENTQAYSQENKSPGGSGFWKIHPYAAVLICVWFFAADWIHEWWVDRPVDSLSDWESNGALLVICFLAMGACVKEQHDRIRKLETTLAARDEKSAQ